MSFLYLDTTDHVIVGIIDNNLEWVDYKEDQERKSSGMLHGLINQITNSNDLEIIKLSGIIYASGPGSYTGIRLAEGLARILAWNNIPLYPFYHFDLPAILGNKEGVFISDAFKGEYFIHQWNGDEQVQKLMHLSDVENFLKENSGLKRFTHFKQSLKLDCNLSGETSQMLHSDPKQTFQAILERESACPPFYFRPVESEFKVLK